MSAEEEFPQAPAPSEPEGAGLRFAYVAGVTPGKWIRRWEERMPDVPLSSFMSDDGAQLSVLRDGTADLSFVRLPVEREGLNVIPLYEEQPVVVAPKGHEISVFEEVALADLAAGNVPGRRPGWAARKRRCRWLPPARGSLSCRCPLPATST